MVVLFAAFGGLAFAQAQQAPQQPPPVRGGAAGGVDPRMEHQIDMMFQNMDANHDGKISKSEWMNFYENLFKRIDGNGDGYITKDEVRADMMEAMKKQPQPQQQRPAAPAQ